MASVELDHIDIDMRDGAAVRVPYWTVQSGVKGPRVLVTAALHGNELQGSEVLRRLLPVLQRDLGRGSCLLLPMANLRAIQSHWPHIDFAVAPTNTTEKLDNVNCTWPGDPNGTNAQRLSQALRETLVEQSTHNFDLHCWNCFNAATALAREGNELSTRLARASSLRFGRQMPWYAEVAARPVVPCVLTAYFVDTGRGAICMEFSGQYGFWEHEIVRGLRAVSNWFRCLDMLPGELEGQEEGFVWLNDAEPVDVPAPTSGLFMAERYAPSDWVEEGALIGRIFGDRDLATTDVHAPASGYLYQYGCIHKNTSEHTMMWTHPYAGEGEVLAQLYARQETA